MIEQCVQLLHQQHLIPLAQTLKRTLGKIPLERPAGHKGSGETFMYKLELSLSQCEQLHGALCHAVNEDLRTSSTQQRGLGGFVAASAELVAASVAKSSTLEAQ